MDPSLVCPQCGSAWSRSSRRTGLGERLTCKLAGTRPVRCLDCDERYFVIHDPIPRRRSWWQMAILVAVPLLVLAAWWLWRLAGPGSIPR